MLNKALLGTPKEFKVTIGSQTHCTASTAKTAYMPGDLVTINISYNTGYHNATVATSTGTPVSKVNNNTYTFVMPSKDVVITASASVMSFTITVNKNAGGNVSVKSVANYGERVTVTMSPLEGYSVGSVSASGASLSGSGNTRTFTMPANNVTINVTFNCVYHTVMTVGKYTEGRIEEYGYYNCGSLSRIPYWKSPTHYLLYLYQDGKDWMMGMGINGENSALPSTIKVNNVQMGSRYIGYGHVSYYNRSIKYDVFKGKTNQKVNVIFDPPPTGYL